MTDEETFVAEAFKYLLEPEEWYKDKEKFRAKQAIKLGCVIMAVGLTSYLLDSYIGLGLTALGSYICGWNLYKLYKIKGD